MMGKQLHWWLSGEIADHHQGLLFHEFILICVVLFMHCVMESALNY